jgi:Terminase-like family.
MRYDLNIVSPYNKTRPYPKQQEFLEMDRGDGRTVKRIHLIAGRGTGKTSIGIVDLTKESLVRNPGLPNLWIEPTYRHCMDVFYREFRRIVPKELYTFRKAEMVIDWITGATTDIRSRHADNAYREVNKGPNYAAAYNDESAYKFDKVKYWDVDAAIRHPQASALTHICMTTPKMNEYYDLVHSSGHEQINAKSADNPHLPPGWVDERAGLMDEKRRLQELEGAWVSLTDMIWYGFSSATWPEGNIHPHVHDFSEPYYLAFDIGVASSAWQIIQPVRTDTYTVYVVTAEYTPRRDADGSVDGVAARIKQEYGQPAIVIAGADLETRGSGDAKRPSWFIRRHFGGVQIRPIDGWIADKEIQYTQACFALHAADGKRRFCISAGLKSHDPDTKRGITEVMLARLLA